jgi:HrpA-like RNA helicase
VTVAASALSLRFCNALFMSATIDSERFARYFGDSVPIVHVPGFTHHVTDFFLEDVIQKCGYKGGGCKGGVCTALPFAEWRGGTESASAAAAGDCDAWREWLNALVCSRGDVVAAAVQRVSYDVARDIDLQLIVRVIESICESGADGAILVFLPGWAHITQLYDMLSGSGCIRHHSCLLLPLHSQLSMNDHAAVFARPPPGVRKIVIATAIAGNCCCSRRAHTPLLTSALLPQKPPSPSTMWCTSSTRGAARAGAASPLHCIAMCVLSFRELYTVRPSLRLPALSLQRVHIG